MLVIASLNRAKVQELVVLLGDLPFDLRPLGAFPGASLPEETGSTYADNALLKARAAMRQTGALSLADDSGLEVEALGGAPGVRSARFGGAGLDDAGRCRLLLETLRGVPLDRRGARFRCVMAVVHPDGREHLVEGAVEGLILHEPRGHRGFGYDPLFYHRPLGRAFAELPEADKDRVGHRGIAARAARRLLIECYTPNPGG